MGTEGIQKSFIFSDILLGFVQHICNLRIYGGYSSGNITHSSFQYFGNRFRGYRRKGAVNLCLNGRSPGVCNFRRYGVGFFIYVVF